MTFLTLAAESATSYPFKPSGIRVGLASVDAFIDALVWLLPVWTSLAAGLVVGWSWKPTWVTSGTLFSALRGRTRLVWTTPPGFGARRVWLALTALAVFPALQAAWGKFYTWMWPKAVHEGIGQQQEVAAPSQAGLGRWFEWLLVREKGDQSSPAGEVDQGPEEVHQG
jgi:hypothetical protein